MTLIFHRFSWIFLGSVILLGSCRAYKQDILFRLNEDFTPADLAIPVSEAEASYKIQPGDVIQIDVFTNKGERLIDPNFELSQGMNQQNVQLRERYQYLVRVDGMVKLPVVGSRQIARLTLNEAEAYLERAYNEYYKESFVKLKLTNRRIIVLGANGGQVIPIENENTSLIEVLALYGGLNLGAKAGNIKVIRGDLSKPEVYQIDLSTIHGMQSSIVEVKAGDIIYVEPWRRPWIESLRDFSPVLSLASSVLTLIVVVQNLSSK